MKRMFFASFLPFMSAGNLEQWFALDSFVIVYCIYNGEDRERTPEIRRLDELGRR